MKTSFAAWLIVGFSVSFLLAQDRIPVSVPEEEMQKLLIHRVDPVLPPEPGMRLQGPVVLGAVISRPALLRVCRWSVDIRCWFRWPWMR